MPITLQNSQATPSLYLPATQTGGWFAYLLPPGVTAAASFTLDSTWIIGAPGGSSFPGYYLFCPQAPQSLTNFVQNAYAYLQQGNYTGIPGRLPYFVWVHEPDAVNLDTDVMTVTSGFPNPTIISAGVNIRLGNNYTLFLAGGSGVVANWTASPPVFTIRGQGNQFTANNHSISNLANTVTLPMDGPFRGCLQTQIVVSTNPASRDYAFLDAGLRYYSAGATAPAMQSFPCPVFAWPTSPTTFTASLNPLTPTDPTTSYLAFPTGAAFTSYFRTALGQVMTLNTLPTSRLAFQLFPSSTAPPANVQPTLTMAPCGDFAVSLPAYSGTGSPLIASQSVMCGVAGTEYVGPSAVQSTAVNLTLTFTPGQPAYAPNVQPGSGSQPGTSGASTSLLTSAATTAWVSFSSGSTALSYYAQPNKGELYNPSGGDLLSFLEVIAQPLSGASAAVPMVPYAGVVPTGGLALADYANLELQALSPSRRQGIGASTHLAGSPAPTAGNPTTGATPQGLLATVQGPTWTQIILAQDASGTQMQFYQNGTPLPTALTTALQTNQQFLIISDPTILQGFLGTTSTDPPNSIDIAGWNFVIDPAQWSAHGTVMVFKFRHGTLQQFVADTSVWTEASTFNTTPDPATVSSTLSTIVNDAVNSQDPDFQFFASQIATNADWNGILFFNCTVPLASLPAEIEGLAAGIDASKFYAHHLGIQVTPLQYTGGQLTQQQSSLFGLIYYANDSYPPADNSGYNFNVLNLRVLFENSVIKSFASQIEVSLDKLFGEPVIQEHSASNSIVLNGSYQSQGTTQSYVFGESGDNVFHFANSKVLNNVEILQAQFTTSIPPGTTHLKDGDPVQTRFAFWGNLNFQQLRGFDVFSFGTDPAQTGTNPYFLRFSNLGVEMDFTFSSGALSSRTFTFDPNHLSFDLQYSQARTASLYNHFPLKLTGLVSATAKQMPSDLGFMQIDTPLAGASLTHPWYGLTFDLNMGSVGALAGKIGLVASIVAAWSPSATNYNVLVGLKLPGSSGSAKEISFEGVLKLTFQDIEFLVSGDAYILKLDNIALKILSVSLPPNGQTDFLLFGDPKQIDNSTLGWYAAYAQKPTPRTNGSQSARSRTSTLTGFTRSAPQPALLAAQNPDLQEDVPPSEEERGQ